MERFWKFWSVMLNAANIFVLEFANTTCGVIKIYPKAFSQDIIYFDVHFHFKN